MLPRNHSLTTPVRLMPQYERSYVPSMAYETVVPGYTNSKNHFQDSGGVTTVGYNYHFHGDYSNGFVVPPPGSQPPQTSLPSSSHDIHRPETYWHPVSKRCRGFFFFMRFFNCFRSWTCKL